MSENQSKFGAFWNAHGTHGKQTNTQRAKTPTLSEAIGEMGNHPFKQSFISTNNLFAASEQHFTALEKNPDVSLINIKIKGAREEITDLALQSTLATNTAGRSCNQNQ